MKKLYALLFAATLFPFFLKAQSNYKPGYAITVKGDTLRGFIDLREWQLDPRNINFKTSANANETRILGPSAITFFDISGLVSYQRYIGKLNVDRTSTTLMINGRDTTTITDTLFLKFLQKGSKVSLYEYNDKIKNHFFVADNVDGKPTELVYRIYNDGDKTVTETGYIRQLYALAVKYGVGDALRIQIERADYKLLDLEKITAKINNIDKKDIEKTPTLNKGTTFFVGIGLNLSTTTTKDIFPQHTSSTSFFPRVSVGLNVLGNPNVGRFVFRVEAAFTGNKIRSNNNFNDPINSMNNAMLAIDQYTVSIIPQVIYNFYNTDKFKFYGGAGAAFSGSKYNNNTNLIVTDGWTYFPLKLGVVLNKKIDISVAYSPSVGITNTNSYEIAISILQAGLNYNF
ncbi:outer membrane protein [Mucilaginibacter aquaedulcis]|uniref:outer membrane protein n=1 Tax=Mucilaginibacter aquaedulcis TaxID=1187081 RepID=UPI0025B57D2A|nr:hypothetical protein [Mucilaginibacter aquaedulcis]MDN3549412.1 hypothetical protein [Mucilaginibacter aquaedulcis]